MQVYQPGAIVFQSGESCASQGVHHVWAVAGRGCSQGVSHAGAVAGEWVNRRWGSCRHLQNKARQYTGTHPSPGLQAGVIDKRYWGLGSSPVGWGLEFSSYDIPYDTP